MLDYLTIVLSIYVIAESLSAICAMPKGYTMLCHKMKYVFAFASSLSFIYYALQSLSTSTMWLIFGSVGTMALFIWPRTVYRLKH